MPINALIPLSGKTPDLMQAVAGGLSNANQIQMQPYKNALLDTQVKSSQQSLDQSGRNEQLKQVQVLGNIVGDMGPEEIKNNFGSIMATAKQAGLPIEDDDLVPDEKHLGILYRAGQYAKSVLNRGDGASYRQFKSMTKDLTPEEQDRARRINLGLDPRAVGSASITIANTGQTDRVAGSEATIAGAKAGATEEAKLEKQLMFKPAIAESVKLAEQRAADRGETLTALARSEAAMPGLMEAVGQLKELAPIATSTIGGKVFDQAVKQSGFGATEGATARAKFVAIINNQVLPLLRDTFGAAFTEKEGESLKATMGDPDASPAEKIAQLDAFIAQKNRDIETKQRELANPLQQIGAGAYQSSTGIQFTVE